MALEEIKRLTYKINTVILIMVFGLMAFFFLCKAMFLVWFSIPTALVYVGGYALISKKQLDIYVRMVYGWLTLYMSVTTICLGYSFGFHLYSLSMIPIIFYTEYMAYKLNMASINTTLYSALVIGAYFVSTGYTAFMRPIYEIDPNIAGIFWITNSLIVLGFVTFYSRLMIRMVKASDKLLTDRANKDRLTRLYNRHYMMEKLREAYDDDNSYIIAMIDIDDFKSINDMYGHSAGDEVLRQVASVMESVCGDSIVSRWGGEEFLILTRDDISLIDKLRKEIEDLIVDYEGKKINVTMTAGVEPKNRDITLDKWLVTADEKLYTGKTNGKNQVVS